MRRKTTRAWFLVAWSTIAISLGIAGWSVSVRWRAEAGLAEIPWRNARLASASERPRTVAVAPAAPPRSVETAPAPDPSAPPRPEPKQRPDIGELLSTHPDLLTDYEKSFKGQLDQRYRRLFQRLRLSPQQVGQIEGLLLRDDENELDLAMTAASQGFAHDDPTAKKFRQDQKIELKAALQGVLGPGDYETLQRFDQAQRVRSWAEDVAGLLALSPTPLTGEQRDQLTQIVADASSSYQKGGIANIDDVAWERVLATAPTFLAEPQQAALRAKVQMTQLRALLPQFFAQLPQAK